MEDLYAEASITLNGRQEFIDFFVSLGESIDAKHLDDIPEILIAGGGGSGKSLAAEVIIKALDDEYDNKAVRNLEPDNKFFLEENQCDAAFTALQRTSTAGGLTSKFYFSSEGHPESVQRETFEQDGSSRGLMVMSSAPGSYGTSYSDIVVDIGEEKFNPDEARAIKVGINGYNLTECPTFNRFWDGLEQSADTWSSCEIPSTSHEEYTA